ncbi:MAG: LLM class flavin-dependent oxidoreductase, partial [Pseudomonadota bacterium]
QWLPLLAEHGPVPIEMVPSGPKVAGIAARYADRISFAIGRNPDYIRHFVHDTRQQIEAAGRDPAAVKLGAWVNVVLNDDRQTALNAVRGTTGIWARFSLMRPDRSSLPEPLKEALGLLSGYEMESFGQGEAVSEADMPDAFVDWFSIAGDTEHVFERLSQLLDLGLDYLCLVPGQLGFQDQVGSASIARVAREILPRLRGINGSKDQQALSAMR